MAIEPKPAAKSPRKYQSASSMGTGIGAGTGVRTPEALMPLE